MDRRKFLKSSVLAGVTGAAAVNTASCSAVKFLESSAPDEPLPDMDAVLAEMDEGMRRISVWNPIDDFTGTPEQTPERAEANSVARNAVKSLYVTAMFTDMPIAAQLQPGVQARIQQALPEIDASAASMDRYLATNAAMSDDELQAVLRRDDDPGMRFLEQFNQLAAAHGITAQRRLQIRAMTTNILWRLKNQPPSLLIDECRDKMKRAAASTGPDAAARHLVASRVTEEAFWQWQEQQDGDPEDNEDYMNWTDSDKDDPADPQKKKNEQSSSARGARTMGIGLLLFAAGGALAVSGVAPGVVLGTVGAIFFLIGLIRLLASIGSNDAPDEDEKDEKRKNVDTEDDWYMDSDEL